jgi:hypothetical protein
VSPVRVVLDSTALLAYARLQGLATAELIALIEEEGGLAGLPAASFLTAYEQLESAEEQHRLIRLATAIDGVTVLLPLAGADTVEAAQLSPGPGHAIIEARTRGAYLATYEPDLAVKHLGPLKVLTLQDS